MGGFFYYLCVVMYSNSTIKTCLETLVGIRQNTNPQFGLIDTNLTVSDSGLFVDNPLITVANIDQALETTDPDYYKVYDNAFPYKAGARIKEVIGTNIRVLNAKIDTTGNAPPVFPATENTQWVVVDPISEYLDTVRCDATLMVFNEVYNKKKLHEEVKDVFNNVPLFRGSGRINENISNLDKLVGFEIQLDNVQYLTLVLNRISTQLTQAQELDIFIYHSSQNEPIETIHINYVDNKSSEWHDLNGKASLPVILPETILEFTSGSHDIGGTFYICYKQSELTGQAINKDYDPYNRPCACPPDYNGKLWDIWSQWYKCRTFEIAESKLPGGTELWDISQNIYTSNTNYGLNLEFSLKCDISTFICQNKVSFAQAIKLKMEIMILEMLVNTLRTDKTAEKVISRANKALNDINVGGVFNPSNIQNKYNSAIKAINFDLSDIQTSCMPCTGNEFGTTISNA